MDIEKITKDPNPGFLFFLFCEVCVNGRGDMQDKGRCWQGSGSNYLHI